MRVLTAHLDPLALPENVVLLARLDLLVSQDVLALKDPQALLERKADRVRKDLKAQLEEMAFRDLWVCQDLEDLLDHPERMETRESSENPARKEAKVTKENMVPLVPLALKDPSEHPVPLVQMVSPDPEVSRVCLARKEMKDQGDSPDLRARSGCRACLVHLVRKEKLETSGKWVHPVPLAPEVPQDLQEPMALRDLLVVLETPALSEKRETLVKPESRVFRENSAHQVQEESEEKRESRVRLVQRDLPAPRVPLEMTVPKAALVRADSLVTLVLLESLVQLG